MEKIENFDSLNDFLSQFDDNVSIISGDIPVKVQISYYDYLEKNLNKKHGKRCEMISLNCLINLWI